MSDGHLGRRFAGSAVWVVLEQWSTKLISLAVFAVLARLLGPADFGLVALATSVIAILQVFTNSGFSKALIQKKDLDPLDATTAFWTSLAISVVVYGCVLLTAHPVAALFHKPELAGVLTILGLTLPLSSLSRTPAALLAREFGFRSLSVRTIIATLAGSVVALPLAFAGAGVWALVVQALTESAVAVIVLWSATTWRPAFAYSSASLRSLWRTGSALLGIELLDAVQSQIDKLVIGAFFSTSELGIYSLAQRLGVMLQEIATSVVTKVSLTTFSRIQDDLDRVGRIFRQLTFFTASVTFPLFALVAVLSPQIVPFLFGPGWDGAIPLIWIMAGGWAFASVAMFDRSALVGTGHAGAALGLAVAQNIISVALVFLFLPLGVAGIAVSRFARVITWPLRLWALRRWIGLASGAYTWQVLKCALAVLPATVIIAVLQSTAWASSDAALWTFALPLGVAGALVSIALTLLFAGRSGRRDLVRQFRSFRRKGGNELA